MKKIILKFECNQDIEEIAETAKAIGVNEIDVSLEIRYRKSIITMDSDDAVIELFESLIKKEVT